MRLTWKDAAATGLTAVIVALYLGYLAGAGLPVVDSPRVLAAVALVLGIGACVVGGSMIDTAKGLPATPGARLFSFFGAVAFVAGVAVMITASEALLAVEVGTIAGLWFVATLRHLLTPVTGTPSLPELAPTPETAPEQPEPVGRREREMSRG